MKPKTTGCQDIFLWTSSIIGFIVDTIALVSLITAASTTGVLVSEPPLIPKLTIGTLAISWRDLTGVLLVYVGITFAAISIRTRVTKGVLITTSYLSHFFAALVLLWLMLFLSLADLHLYLGIAEAWLTGLLILVILHVWKFSLDLDLEDWPPFLMNLLKLPTASVITLIIVLPGWSFLKIAVNSSSWISAILDSLVAGLIGILTSFALWILSVIFVAAIAGFWGFFRNNEPSS